MTLRHTRIAILLFLPILFLPILATLAVGQNQAAVDPSLPPPPHEKKIHLKRVLVISQTRGLSTIPLPTPWWPSIPWAAKAVSGRPPCAPTPSSSPRKLSTATPRIWTTSMPWFL